MTVKEAFGLAYGPVPEGWRAGLLIAENRTTGALKVDAGIEGPHPVTGEPDLLWFDHTKCSWSTAAIPNCSIRVVDDSWLMDFSDCPAESLVGVLGIKYKEVVNANKDARETK